MNTKDPTFPQTPSLFKLAAIVAVSSALSLRGQALIATSRNIAARNAVTILQGKNTHAPQGDLNLKTDRWPKISLITIPSVFDCGPLQNCKNRPGPQLMWSQMVHAPHLLNSSAYGSRLRLFRTESIKRPQYLKGRSCTG